MTTAIAWTQAALVSQNLASVAVDPLVLSVRLTVAQSKLMVSGQVILYQSERLTAPVGAVDVCATGGSPSGGAPAPSTARDGPRGGNRRMGGGPRLFQPVRALSKRTVALPTAEGPGSAH